LPVRTISISSNNELQGAMKEVTRAIDIALALSSPGLPATAQIIYLCFLEPDRLSFDYNPVSRLEVAVTAHALQTHWTSPHLHVVEKCHF